MNDQNPREQAIADGARQLPAEQRANDINAACGAEAELTRAVSKDAWFDATRWTVIHEAGGPESSMARAARARLCQSYWYPSLHRTGHLDPLYVLFSRLVRPPWV